MIKMINIVFDELVFLCYKSENTLGNSNEFEAYIRNGHSNYNSWLVLKSNVTGTFKLQLRQPLSNHVH